MLYMFQAVPPPIIRSSKLYKQHRVLCQNFTATCHCRGRAGTMSSKAVYTALCTLLLPATVVEEIELNSISSTTVAGSSKVLKKHPMLYIQFLSSWWWAEVVASLPRQWQVAVKVWQSTRCCITVLSSWWWAEVVPSLPRKWQVAVKFRQSTRCCI